jgi:hypothetical protein
VNFSDRDSKISGALLPHGTQDLGDIEVDTPMAPNLPELAAALWDGRR